MPYIKKRGRIVTRNPSIKYEEDYKDIVAPFWIIVKKAETSLL